MKNPNHINKEMTVLNQNKIKLLNFLYFYKIKKLDKILFFKRDRCFIFYMQFYYLIVVNDKLRKYNCTY